MSYTPYGHKHLNDADVNAVPMPWEIFYLSINTVLYFSCSCLTMISNVFVSKEYK